MAFSGHTVLAVVPARGGSKGIPRKNLRQVCGLSLVGHAARTALAVPAIDRAVLSTDDREIAEEGRRQGLDVPFMRPDELASDLSGSIDMWRHAWLASESHYGMRFDVSVLLEPTSPCRTPADVLATLEALFSGDYDAAATVSRAPAHFTPHKCLTVNEAGILGFYLPAGAGYATRQKIPPYYFRNGLCYAVKRATLVDGGRIIEERCKAVVIERHVVNIDDEFELELAEYLLTRHPQGRPT